MTHSNEETTAFRSYELKGWENIAEAYDDHFQSLTSQTVEPLLDTVRATDQIPLLDIATGPGYVAAAAKRRNAQVIGIDFSEPMILKAKQNYPEIDFRVGDAEALLFADGEFEAVVMNFGILHLAQPKTALAEAFRVLQPHGRCGFTAWAPPEESTGFKIVLQAIEKHGDLSIPLPKGPPFFLFGNENACREALAEVGFTEVAFSRLTPFWKFKTNNDLFNAIYSGTARTGGLLRAQSKTAIEAIRLEIQTAMEAFKKEDLYHIPMPAIVASGKKP